MCGAVASAWCVPSHACMVAFDRKIDAELVAEGTESQSRDHRDHRTGRTGNPILAGRPVYVLADSTKLGKRPFHAWVRLPAPWILVTDNRADPDQVELFRQSGVTVQVVDVAPAQAA